MIEWKYVGIDRNYELILVREKGKMLYLDAECLAKLYMDARDGKLAEPKRRQTVRNADGEFVPFTCSCWNANPTEGDKHHNGRCTKYYDCIRTRENDPFPTMSGKTHKTYCVKRKDEVENG